LTRKKKLAISIHDFEIIKARSHLVPGFEVSGVVRTNNVISDDMNMNVTLPKRDVVYCNVIRNNIAFERTHVFFTKKKTLFMVTSSKIKSFLHELPP